MNEEKIPPSPQKKLAFVEIVKEIVIFAMIAFGIVLPFRLYIAEPYIVDGASMDPTFHTGDYLIVDKLSYEIGKPQRNTVVIFRYPNDPRKSFIKRIVGLPGETITMKDNVVIVINPENPKGLNLDQSYVVHKCLKTTNNCVISFEETLGVDEYYVLGDNRAESFDSRSWGPLNKKYLLGKPILQLWPLKQISLFPGKDRK
ncbi:MAG: signal peptidase I [Candidatus Zambryskibacteria bacterium]|nr:signal peptidase I [Candidatus Zambryskibacteria bacterium]